MQKPTLYIFSGLPGTGKSTIASMLARHFNAVYLRIDTIEQGIRDYFDDPPIRYGGYQLTHRIASDNLQLGNSTVADACSDSQFTREGWRQVAIGTGSDYVFIETICSDADTHRRRIETRQSQVPNLELPAWQEVLDRERHDWDCKRITIDTAHCTPKESFHQLLSQLEKHSA